MIGTIINAIAVIIGSIIGLLIKSKLPKNISEIAFQGVGLFTIILGVIMAIKTNNFLFMIVSIVIGSILGELLNIDEKITRFGEWLKRKLKTKNDRFSEGFMTAFLLYCMGSMTILGAIEEGFGGQPNLLISKSILDGFSSIILSSTMGIGVLFSSIPLFLFQGGLTLFASYVEPVFTEIMITELSAVGGILLLGLGMTMLDIKKIRVVNMLPSLLIITLLSYLFL